MTVKELIEILEGYPSDSVIEVSDPVEDMALDIDKVEMENEIVYIVVH